MLVIHPEDRTTTILQVLYKGLGVQVVTEDCSNREIGHLLHHTSTTNRILLLGHGSDKGLYYREDDTKNEFDKIIPNRSLEKVSCHFLMTAIRKIALYMLDS